MARDVAVLWEVVWVLSEVPVIAEYPLDNTHCRFYNNQGHVNFKTWSILRRENGISHKYQTQEDLFLKI